MERPAWNRWLACRCLVLVAAVAACSSTATPGPTDARGDLKRYLTCGDPVCRGYTAGSSAPLCTSEMAGDVCSVEGQRCDPRDECNALLVCASSDPRMQPTACPISRRRFKSDVHYLAPAELARYRDQLLGMKLATWRYKQDPARERLGFMIDDNEQSVAVDPDRDLVDLYGYASLAVATIQLQAQEIDALKREVAQIKNERHGPRHRNSTTSAPREAGAMVR